MILHSLQKRSEYLLKCFKFMANVASNYYIKEFSHKMYFIIEINFRSKFCFIKLLEKSIDINCISFSDLLKYNKRTLLSKVKHCHHYWKKCSVLLSISIPFSSFLSLESRYMAFTSLTFFVVLA